MPKSKLSSLELIKKINTNLPDNTEIVFHEDGKAPQGHHKNDVEYRKSKNAIDMIAAARLAYIDKRKEEKYTDNQYFQNRITSAFRYIECDDKYTRNGFSAKAFINDEKKEIEIILTGTNHINDLDDNNAIFQDRVPWQHGDFMKFFYEQILGSIEDTPNLHNYRIKLIGHSLGGFLAQIGAADLLLRDFMVTCVAINPPGARDIIADHCFKILKKELRGRGNSSDREKIKNSIASFIKKLEQINVTIISNPEVINTSGKQLGEVFNIHNIQDVDLTDQEHCSKDGSCQTTLSTHGHTLEHLDNHITSDGYLFLKHEKDWNKKIDQSQVITITKYIAKSMHFLSRGINKIFRFCGELLHIVSKESRKIQLFCYGDLSLNNNLLSSIKIKKIMCNELFHPSTHDSVALPSATPEANDNARLTLTPKEVSAGGSKVAIQERRLSNVPIDPYITSVTLELSEELYTTTISEPFLTIPQPFQITGADDFPLPEEYNIHSNSLESLHSP